MEPDAMWGHCEFQLANWNVEEPTAEVWAPTGLPVEYAAIDIFGTCSLQQAYAPESSGGQQLVEYYYSTASQPDGPSDEEQGLAAITYYHENGETKISNSHVSCVLKQSACEFKADIDMMKEKMHRYPASFHSVDKSYTEPKIVVIGPYHRNLVHRLKKAEEAKRVAFYHCIRESDLSPEELHGAVAPVADNARFLYDKDVMAGICIDHFRWMMTLDAYFLVQYMLMEISGLSSKKAPAVQVDESLHGFLSPNRIDIFRDVMLLENQLPWKVVETVMSFVCKSRELSTTKKFVKIMGYCMLPDRYERDQLPKIKFDFKDPPHLLGLLRHHIIGKWDNNKGASTPPKTKKKYFP